MNLSSKLINITFCLMFITFASQAKTTWEVPVPIDTSKKTTEAAAEVGPTQAHLSKHHKKKHLLAKKSRKKRYNVGKRRAKKPRKNHKSKSAFSTAFFLIFLGLFTLGLLAWLDLLALWVLGIFHFLGIFALFGSVFLIEDFQGLVLLVLLFVAIIPLLAILGLLSFGLTFFSWGAAVIGGATVFTAAFLLLMTLLGFSTD